MHARRVAHRSLFLAELIRFSETRFRASFSVTVKELPSSKAVTMSLSKLTSLLSALLIIRTSWSFTLSRCETNGFPLDWKCDGMFDCADGFDEANCTSKVDCPSSNSFFCELEKKCIRSSQVCDSTFDCSDGSDEGTVCSNFTCLETDCGDHYTHDHHTHECIAKELCDEHASLCDRPTSGHECLSLPGGYQCKCASGHYNWDDKSCLNEGYKADGWMLHIINGTISLHGIDEESKVLYNVPHGSKSAPGAPMDFNFHKNYFVWVSNNATTNNATVYAAKLFKDKPSLIESDEPIELFNRNWAILRVAIDWINDVIYVTANRRVEAVNVTSAKSSLLLVDLPITDSVFTANHIAVSPGDNLVFSTWRILWIMWFERANLDGSNREVVSVEGPVEHLESFILGLAIDLSNKKLYWLSTNQTSVFVNYANYDGSNRTSFLIDYTNAILGSFNAFDVMGEYVFVSANDTFYYVNKHGIDRRLRKIGVANCDKFAKLVHPAMQPLSANKCLDSGCTELCLPNAKNFSCYTSSDKNFRNSATWKDILDGEEKPGKALNQIN